MNKTRYPGLDETLFTARLANGLTVLVVPKPGFSKKMAYLVTDYGAVHRNFTLDGEQITVPAGVAHYLEHKMFDLPGRDVSAEFASLGASVNAFTSYDMTAYYFSCTEKFDDCLRLLLEFVGTPYFTQESVEKERGIIDQEIGMNEDDAGTQAFENLTRAMYARHPIREPILGTAASIREITPQLLHLCHRAFYNPSNMVLCVVGDVEAEAVAGTAEAVLGTRAYPAGEKILLPAETMPCPRGRADAAMEIAMPTFAMGFKCEPAGKGEEAIRQEIVGELAAEALFGESSELYLQMYGRGLIDSSFGGGFDTVDGCAMLNCGGDSDDPDAVRDAILAQAARIAETGLEEAVFARMKRSAMGRRIRDLDSFDSTCFRLCAYRLSGFDYFRFPEIYNSVGSRQICDFLGRVVRPERCSLSVVNTLKEEKQ